MPRSKIEVGIKGGHTSAEVLRATFHRAQGNPVSIRVVFQVFGVGEREYRGLRDHTIRFKVESRRQFERVHGAMVDTVDACLDATTPPNPDRENSVDIPMTLDEQEAMSIAEAEDESRQEV